MNDLNRPGPILRTLLCVGAVFLAIVCQGASSEPKFDVLHTRTGSYTNVTVTTKSKSYVFIFHSAGMANVRVEDLSDEAKEELGYAVPESKKTKATVVLARDVLPEITQKIQPLQKDLEPQMQMIREKLLANKQIVIGAIAIIVLSYIFFCYCCHLICIKAKKPASVLVWLPVFKWIPMLQAANMSGWWILLWYFPLPVVPVIWCFNIASARDKSPLVGVLLILPVTSFLAFLYLAFADDANPEPPQKFKSMPFQATGTEARSGAA